MTCRIAIVGIFISLVVGDVMFCPKYQAINSLSDVVNIISIMAPFRPRVMASKV